MVCFLCLAQKASNYDLIPSMSLFLVFGILRDEQLKEKNNRRVFPVFANKNSSIFRKKRGFNEKKSFFAFYQVLSHQLLSIEKERKNC